MLLSAHSCGCSCLIIATTLHVSVMHDLLYLRHFQKTTAAHSSVRRASPAVLWETLHSAFLCVEAGHSTLMAPWWPLMWLPSCQQPLVLLPP